MLVVSACVIGLALGSIALLHYNNSLRFEHALLASTLSGFVVPGYPLERSSSYSFLEIRQLRRDVRALRAQWYATTHRLSPLFALEGVDTDELQIAVADLKHALKKIAAHYPRSDRSVIENSFFPISFLQMLPELESRRRELIANPTPLNARLYQAQLRTTHATYIHNLRELRSALAQYSEDAGYYFPTGYVDGVGLAKTLTNLESQVRTTYAREQNRLSCLNRFDESCPSLQELWEHIIAVERVGGAQRNPDAHVPSAVARNAQILTSAFEPQTDILGANNSIVVLSESSCNPTSHAPEHYLLTPYPYVSAGVGVEVDPINDLYFNNLSESSFVQLRDALQERGVSIAHQSLGAFYMCIDYGDVFARTTTVKFISGILADESVRSLLTSIGIENLRQTYAGEFPVVYENDVQRVATDISTHLRSDSERNLADRLGAENVLQLEHIVALWNQGGVGIADVMQNIHENSLWLSRELPLFDIPLGKSFLDRTAISTLYFLSNRSFYATTTSLSSERHDVRLSDLNLLSLRRDVPHRAPDEISHIIACAEAVEIEILFPEKYQKLPAELRQTCALWNE